MIEYSLSIGINPIFGMKRSNYGISGRCQRICRTAINQAIVDGIA
jgi:hypothetical protein